MTNYEGDIPEEIIVRIFTQILLGMHFLNRNDVYHRDIKPTNILMFDDG